jgi:membrane dipeptidase
MKILTNILILFLFIQINIYTQEINFNGNVQDLKNHSPIEKAKIQIKNLTTGVIDSTFSDALGNWQFSIVTSTNDNSLIIPDKLEVMQNFPNPFNPSTKIGFSTTNNDNVNIKVHNILGELISEKTFYLNAGNYIIDWFSKGSAGVYLYTLTSGKQSITKKMIQLDGGDGIGLGEIRTGLTLNLNKENKRSSNDVEIVVTKFSYASDTTISQILGNEHFNTYLQTVHSKYTLIDLHNDILEVMAADTSYHLGIYHDYNHTDIPRLQEGGVDVQFFSVWVSPTQFTDYFGQALVMRNLLSSEINNNIQNIAVATTMQQALELNHQNKIAAVIGVEGGHSIENSIDNLFTLYNLGMRYLTITWNNSTDWAISAKDSRSNIQGLNEFGKLVIHKLDSLGVIIDVSHTGIQTIRDILTETKNPIVATHSGARSIYDHYRNLYDWQIQDIANSGGVIGIVFYPYFLNGSSNSSIDDVINHIDHIVNLVGTDYVALGSDFDGIEVTPFGLEDVSKFPDLTLALLQHGYSELDVAKFLGRNFQRVFEKVCKQ